MKLKKFKALFNASLWWLMCIYSVVRSDTLGAILCFIIVFISIEYFIYYQHLEKERME